MIKSLKEGLSISTPIPLRLWSPESLHISTPRPPALTTITTIPIQPRSHRHTNSYTITLSNGLQKDRLNSKIEESTSLASRDFLLTVARESNAKRSASLST